MEDATNPSQKEIMENQDDVMEETTEKAISEHLEENMNEEEENQDKTEERNKDFTEKQMQLIKDEVAKNLAIEKLEDLEKEMFCWQEGYNELVDTVNSLLSEECKKQAANLSETIANHEQFKQEANLKCSELEDEVEMNLKRSLESKHFMREKETQYKVSHFQLNKEQNKVEKLREKHKLKLEEKRQAEELQKSNSELSQKLTEKTLKSQELAKTAWQTEIDIRDSKSKLKAMETELLKNNARCDELEAKTKDFKQQSEENEKRLKDVLLIKLKEECVKVDQHTQAIAKSLAQTLEKRQESIAKKSELLQQQEDLVAETVKATNHSEQLKNQLKAANLKSAEKKKIQKKHQDQLKQDLSQLKKQNKNLKDQKKIVEFNMQDSKFKYEDMIGTKEMELDLLTEDPETETADSSFELSFDMGSSLSKLEKVNIISPTQFLKNSMTLRSFIDDNPDNETTSSSS